MDSYTKTTWVDNSLPALSAENLNHIEQGIKDVTDEVIGGTLHIVDVPYTAENNADTCTNPNTLYYVWVASNVVTHGKMYVLCTPRASGTMSQVALSKEGFLLIRSSQNADFSNVEWVLIPTASNVSTMINNAVSGKANSSDVYTKTQADEKFVDLTTYTEELDDVNYQLGFMESTSNKVTYMPDLPTNVQYMSALAVKNYVEAAIAAALNNS